jgi:hypothetical protein
MASPYAQKLLKIPGIVKDGVLVLASDEKPLPAFSEGASFEILINPIYVADKSRLFESEDERVVPFLPKGTKLLAQVNAEKVPQELKGFLHKSPSHIDNCALVEITLDSDLDIRLRTGREATLMDVGCSSPFLEGREDPPIAVSINHAYTLISTYFEPHRKSHSGNVFDKVFYQPERGNYWLPLRNRRDEIQRG